MTTETSFEEIRELLKDVVNAQKENERRFKETDLQFKQTDKRIKEAFDLFESQWGKLMESLVEGDLVKILNERGIEVTRTSNRQKGKRNGIDFEFDIIAHNGTEIVIVEVKTTLRVKHVNQFIERLKIIKELLPEYKNYAIYGAVAFLRAEEESEIFAENQQLFAIRATGNSASIINDKNFTPLKF